MLLAVAGLVLLALLVPARADADTRRTVGIAEGRLNEQGFWQLRLVGRFEMAHGSWEGVVLAHFQNVSGSVGDLIGTDRSGRRNFSGRCTYWGEGNRTFTGPRLVCDAKAQNGPLTRFMLVFRLQQHRSRTCDSASSEPCNGYQDYVGVYRQRLADDPARWA